MKDILEGGRSDLIFYHYYDHAVRKPDPGEPSSQSKLKF